MNLNELNQELETLFKEEQVIDNFSKARVLNFKKKERKKPMRYILPIGAIFAICLLAINLFPFGTSPTSDDQLSEKEQNKLQQQEENIKNYQQQLEAQKQLFETLINDIPSKHYESIAEELVTYTLHLNDRRFSQADMTALDGEFKLTIGEMFSEVFDTTENQQLKAIYNQMVERNALQGITLLTDHPLEQIDSAGGLSNGYGFRAESTAELKEINPKIIFEVTPYLQKKMKLKSTILTFEISDKPFVPLSFINDEHYAMMNHQNYLVEQTRMLSTALAKMVELHPNP